MKKTISIFIIMTMLLTMLAGCNIPNADRDESSPADASSGESSPAVESSDESEPPEKYELINEVHYLKYNASFERETAINKGSETELPIWKIGSAAEYLALVRDILFYNPDGEESGDYTRAARYTDDFFKGNLLLIFEFHSPGSAYKFKVEGVTVENGKLQAELDSIYCGIGNFSVSSCAAFVEVERETVKDCTSYSMVYGEMQRPNLFPQVFECGYGPHYLDKALALNKDKLTDITHNPVYLFEDLESLTKNCIDLLEYGDEAKEWMRENYTEDFFDFYSLFVVEFFSGDCTQNFTVGNTKKDGDVYYINFAPCDAPTGVFPAGLSWILVYPKEKNRVENCEYDSVTEEVVLAEYAFIAFGEAKGVRVTLHNNNLFSMNIGGGAEHSSGDFEYKDGYLYLRDYKENTFVFKYAYDKLIFDAEKSDCSFGKVDIRDGCFFIIQKNGSN